MNPLSWPRDSRYARQAAACQGWDLLVLAMIGFGLLTILVLIIAGLFGWFESKVIINVDGIKQAAPLPNWAENVLVSIATACTLKLGDVLAVLVQLATGRQVQSMANDLAGSQPMKSPPRQLPPPNGEQPPTEQQLNEATADGAAQATDAAAEEAARLADEAAPDGPRPQGE